MDKNPNIKSIREYSMSDNIYDCWGEDLNTNYKSDCGISDLFIVNQTRWFKINNRFWCRVKFDKSEGRTEKDDLQSSTETITIEIRSYTESVQAIRDFLDEITVEYLDRVNNKRLNRLFIYTYEYVLENQSQYDRRSRRMELSYDCWSECVFNSTRNFSNIFFDQKGELLRKIDFFKNNREWYEKEGHPYTLGLALHGPPGTGKTSVIKCIANYLGRHLVVIPINKIKTQTEFSQCYFQDTYNKSNKKHSISFDNKIIVLDDIDCMSDIVLQRKEETETKPKEKPNIDTNTFITSIVRGVRDGDDVLANMSKEEDDKLTLSFLLNIIDGIRETPGRILIITSNFYNKLDAAMKRPGRIDMAIEMKNASITTICQMYKKYYNESFPNPNRLKNNVLSPAKIVNIKLASRNKEEFIRRICNEMKLS